MKLFAVIGKPILHSRSPQMHNAALAYLQKKGVYLRLATSSAKDALATMQRYGFGGYNITAPYKTDMLETIRDREKAVEVIGGTNTILPTNNGWNAYNTDYLGVHLSIAAKGITIKDKKALIIGAGGAGRAAAFGLHQAGAKVRLINRTRSKAEKAAEMIGCEVAEWQDLEAETRDSDIVVSTLSADIQVIKKEWLSKNQALLDANYQYSTLQKIATEVGCTFVNGKDWLLHQAVPALALFTNSTIEKEAIDVMETALNKDYTLIPKPRTIALIGFMGSGKSSVGKVLANQLGFDLVDVDTLIEEYVGKTIPEIFKEEGETVFREIEKRCLAKALELPNTIVSCGGGVIVTPENRTLLQSKALTIWLMVTPETAVQRIADGTRPLLEGKEALIKAKALYNKRLEWYASSSNLAIDTENQDYKDISKQLYEEISTAIERYG